MDNLMIFDSKVKNKMGFICFLPGVILFTILIYYITILAPLTRGIIEPGSIMLYTLRHYDTMFILLTAYAIIAACVLIYLLIVLTRLKNMNSPTKIIWLLVLCTFVPVSFILFWFFVLNKEPRYVPIYPDFD